MVLRDSFDLPFSNNEEFRASFALLICFFFFFLLLKREKEGSGDRGKDQCVLKLTP